MRVVGLDLAGSPKNPTGYCILDYDERKTVKVGILRGDDEIIDLVKSAGPKLVAIDAPLTYAGVRRSCDEILREYGAIPATMRGMETLAFRGVSLSGRLKSEGFDCIEVFATGTGKILGVFDRDDFKLQKNLMALGIVGDMGDRILVRDELDAILCALTALLHLLAETRTIGDEGGRVVVPDA
jgi:predicted nuclease with RNAse H fold